MPQMAPLMWLNLMVMFLLSFAIFMIINYFMTTPKKISSEAKLISHPNKIWKW
uniref:ATP synthase complex subunit 8 n=1 Tax=Grimothea gregaria TaxID=306053 RepID=A0A342KBK8_9EUCA|nr:ATP synthase F0 subunit 8 [Grimothea gregaria]AND82238.1 ATP synthase F0 subunit 8 [Grimothea gregaria]